MTKQGRRASMGKDISWELSGAQADLADGVYNLAVRPHHVLPFKTEQASVPIVGKVLVTELSGSESSAHFEADMANWVSLARGIHRYHVGENHEFFMDPTQCFVFALMAHWWDRTHYGKDNPCLSCDTAISRTPQTPDDYALKQIDLDWHDGGAYALLGPSGCGKSTLLNIISGLRAPSEGRILFDDQDVTHLPPDQRNIAQVFQFPVIYDTMTVYDNLAFPLRNRGVASHLVDKRVHEIAQILEVEDMLNVRAAGLSPDNKQKISMGRGLVRDDVNVVMFDEPLTVIDPHLKWKLRSKLKELHQRVRATMIYVTHDQTEALTFADQVVVMQEGEIVQIGTPVELFERPAHTFVGHFIGSPRHECFACDLRDGGAFLGGQNVALEGPIDAHRSGAPQIGVRPEYISFADQGLPPWSKSR